MSNTQVNFFQHQISCFVRRPPVLPSVGLPLVVLKSSPVLSFLFKCLNDDFSFLLTFIDCIILIIFAFLRFVNFILYILGHSMRLRISIISNTDVFHQDLIENIKKISGVPLATEPGISLIILPLMNN